MPTMLVMLGSLKGREGRPRNVTGLGDADSDAPSGVELVVSESESWFSGSGGSGGVELGLGSTVVRVHGF